MFEIIIGFVGGVVVTIFFKNLIAFIREIKEKDTYIGGKDE